MRLYCGIDLHSTNSYIVVLDETDTIVLDKRVPNEVAAILGELEPFRERLTSVAVESTFNWYWLADALEDHGHTVELVNTAAAKQYDGLKYRGDKHDARWIAHMRRLGILPTGTVLPRQERALRDLLRRRVKVVQQKTATLLALKNIVARNTGVMVPSNKLKQLKPGEYPDSIFDPHIRRAIDSTTRILQLLEEEAKDLKATALQSGSELRGYRSLLSIRGVGELLALTIVCETGDTSRFRRVNNYASYCRCVRSEHTSNQRKKGEGNRKNGNPYLSWAFSEAAHFAIRYQPPARLFFEKKKRKTNGIIAMRAVANKLSRAAYFLIRDETIYQPEKLFGVSS